MHSALVVGGRLFLGYISVPKVYGFRTFARNFRTFGLRIQAVQNHIGTTTIRPRGAALQGDTPLLEDPDLSYNDKERARTVRSSKNSSTGEGGAAVG